MLTYLVVLPSPFHMAAENNTNSNSSLMSSSGENKVSVQLMGLGLGLWCLTPFSSWRSVLLVKETGVARKNHQPAEYTSPYRDSNSQR